MMMAAPQIVGVLLKKPGGQQSHPRIPPLDPHETKIRGELYVEDLSEKRIVSIRMGWLWVEGTPMRLPLRALNLRQAAPSLCQPHALALGFTLSNSQGHSLATFWADTEPIYWSWVRAIATELIRQTPFRAQRCLNFLEILTICPRGPVPLPDSPTDTRRRSRSELRCWPSDSPLVSGTRSAATILEESRRRARSELRGWSSSNSSDEDLLGEFRSIPAIIGKERTVTRTWGCSESSEGSDDSLPWAGMSRSSVDSVDAPVTLTEPETREQRIQRYKEARRRENEARGRKVLEEDARRRKARAEENNNNNNNNNTNNNNNNNAKNNRNHVPKSVAVPQETRSRTNDNEMESRPRSLRKEANVLPQASETISRLIASNESPIIDRLPPTRPTESTACVRFEDNRLNEDDRTNNNNPKGGSNFASISTGSIGVLGSLRSDSIGERRSRARERRNFREKTQSQQQQQANGNVETLQERKERLALMSSRIPVSRCQFSRSTGRMPLMMDGCASLPRSTTTTSITKEAPCCEEEVAKLLERCQRIDHYVPVREKLTLFESLSRLGGRLARSTEDLGRSSSKPSPRGKQRARSLHDLNRGTRAVPVKEMCRFFEGDAQDNASQRTGTLTKPRFSDPTTPTRTTWRDGSISTTAIATISMTSVRSNDASYVRSSARRKNYAK